MTSSRKTTAWKIAAPIYRRTLTEAGLELTTQSLSGIVPRPFRNTLPEEIEGHQHLSASS
jgi:hypothetical protein